MENTEKPQLNPLQVGKQLKILNVTGNSGADMPLHYCTHEAVICIREGVAELSMDGQIHKLEPGRSFLLPERKEHALKVMEKLDAIVIMPREAEINFVS